MSNHTPGPWKVVPKETQRPDYRPYAIWAGETASWMGVKVAEVLEVSDGHSMRDDWKKANADLIVTAPELLEALKGILHLALEMRGTKTLGTFELSAIEAAKYAITKAEGKGQL